MGFLLKTSSLVDYVEAVSCTEQEFPKSQSFFVEYLHVKHQ